jgi:hypothetical protein
MTESRREALALGLGRRLLDGILAQDWQSIADCFEPDARLRAVVPQANPFRDRVGGREAAEQLKRWFGDADVTELITSTIEPIEDRLHIAYRMSANTSRSPAIPFRV